MTSSAACLRRRVEISSSKQMTAEGSRGGMKAGGEWASGAFSASQGRRNPDLYTLRAQLLAGSLSHSGRCLDRLPARRQGAGVTARSEISQWGCGQQALPGYPGQGGEGEDVAPIGAGLDGGAVGPCWCVTALEECRTAGEDWAS